MALRNDATIAAGTAKRVQEIAKRMGYISDPALSTLSAYGSKLRVHTHYSIIALVTNWSTKDGSKYSLKMAVIAKRSPLRILPLSIKLRGPSGRKSVKSSAGLQPLSKEGV